MKNEKSNSRRDFLKNSALAAILLSTGSFNVVKAQSKKEHDILIRRGLLFDGSGGEGKELDILINGNKILKIGKNISEAGVKEIIDAKGFAVAPGFIDPHTHTDENLLINPLADSFLRQGVTTEIGGNCGESPFPSSLEQAERRKKNYKEKYGIDNADWTEASGFYSKMEEIGHSINYASLLGQGTVREIVVGLEDVPPTEEQLSRMKLIIAEHLKAGVVGLSSGLEYTPSSFAKTDELAELCKIVAQYNSVYTIHLRNEDDTLIEAVTEAIEIAKISKASLQISHLKTCYPRNWHKINELMALIEKAKEEKIDILVDRYPYTAFATGLSTCFPTWSRAGSTSDFIDRLKNPDLTEQIDSFLREKEIKYDSWENVVISKIGSEKNKYCEGKNILELSKGKNLAPIQYIKELIIEERSNVGIITFAMSEENLKTILKHPLTVLGSDGSSLATTGELSTGRPHPRAYGSFARLLGKYVREEKILSLGQAIQKITSLTAKKFNIVNRGELKEGYYADVVIFNPDTIIDKSDWENPHQYADGIEHVFVNGKTTILGKEHTGAKAGKIVRRNEA